MRVMFYLDEGERSSNIGIAKALIEADLSVDDLTEITGYLSVFLENQPILKEKEHGEMYRC